MLLKVGSTGPDVRKLQGGLIELAMLKGTADGKFGPKTEDAEVLALGGGITSAGCVRPLSAGGGAAQSATSLHYCGIAWDLALDSGMQSTANPYIVVAVPNSRMWRVWMRSVGRDVAAVPIVTLQATICTTVGGKTRLHTVPVTGQYVDFTALAARHGFHPISARKSFFTGGSYSGAEFWHYSCTGVLTKNVSTFGGELLKIYSEAQIKASFRGDWDAVRGAVFGVDWF